MENTTNNRLNMNGNGGDDGGDGDGDDDAKTIFNITDFNEIECNVQSYSPSSDDNTQEMLEDLLEIEVYARHNLDESMKTKLNMDDAVVTKARKSSLSCWENDDGGAGGGDGGGGGGGGSKPNARYQLSDVMNDHNYISHEFMIYSKTFNPRLKSSVELKQSLLNYFVSNHSKTTELSDRMSDDLMKEQAAEFSKFADPILQSIELYKKEDEAGSTPDEGNDVKKELPTIDEDSKEHSATIILDEGQILQYAKKIRSWIQTQNESGIENKITVKSTLVLADVKSEQEIHAMNVKKLEGETNVDDDTKRENRSPAAKCEDDVAMDHSSSPPPSTPIDDDLAPNLDASEGGEILRKLTNFADELNDRCNVFRSSASQSGVIADSLHRYIHEKYNELRSLVQLCNISCERGTQTQADRWRRHNVTEAVPMLHHSSDGSSVTSLSDSNDSDCESEKKVNVFRKHTKEAVDSKCCDLKTKMMSNGGNLSDRRFHSEYDDGVPLTKYIQTDIFNSNAVEGSSKDAEMDVVSGALNPRYDSNEEATADEEEDDEETTTNTPMTDMVVAKESATINGSNSFPKDDYILDKEIERLINFNGLQKKHNNTTTNQNTDCEKSKCVALPSKNTKSKGDEDDLSDGFSQKETASTDDNMNESEDEITEKQFLMRYNKNIKDQLLNGSTSCSEDTIDSYDSESETDLMDKRKSNSPLVEKFLKTYDSDDADYDRTPSLTTKGSNVELHESPATDNGSSPLTIGSNVSLPKENDVDAPKETKDVEKSTNKDASTNNFHDDELLKDVTSPEKRTKTKSLEKLLSEAEKRKKQNSFDDDLISLSSDSAKSDAENGENESTEKKHIIKPMLRQDQLAAETRKAQKMEADRIRRLEKKQTMLSKLLSEESNRKHQSDLVLDYCTETKTFIKVHQDLVKHLKQHQIDGIKFMYDSCYGGLDASKKSHGSGCILAHCMGLGKTLQLIALLHTVISYKELKTSKVLVLCPKSTVMNWADEIQRWLGPLNTKNLKLYTFNDISDINEKINTLREWSISTLGKAGCLLIGYEAFRTLVFYHSYKNRGNLSPTRLEQIREKVNKYLLKPGADLVVCDEGHIIKNPKSAISLAVAEIVTPKRIILTGTPIQNNLKEYYSMVNFIKPLFLGTEKEFANLYANPIKNGQHKDSSKRDIKVMKQRSFVLHKKLSKFVQRKEADLLKTFLPPKYEYVLFIPMTEIQNNLYRYILDAISKREDNRGRGLITDYTCLRKIWTHPKVLEDAWKNATAVKYKKDLRKHHTLHSDDDEPDDIYDSRTGVMSVTYDWWRSLVTVNDLETVFPSKKIRTMFEILRMCEENDEKCLIFSAFVAVLNVVEYFFKKINERDPGTIKQLNITRTTVKNRNSWIIGQDYYRLDGKTPKSIRHEMIKTFNSPQNKRARVFLISSKAGGQGINLIGANRVIILDTSWNPSNDQQNIFRIFRLGQKKNCYIYRLLAMGTMEEKVYSRSVTKQAMSFRVVDEQQIDRHYNMAELAELYTLTTPDYGVRPMPIFPQDNILANLLLNYPDLVYKYHEHDSLLENQLEQELSEQEKADAWAAYEKDLQFNTEIREMPQIDPLNNNFFPHQIQSYYNSMQEANASGLFGYNSIANAAMSSSLRQTLAQYNFPSTSQQYLEMFNILKKMSPSLMIYPELSKMFADGAYANTAGNPLNKLPVADANGSIIPDLPCAPSPLSALGNLSLYGIEALKNQQRGGVNPFGQPIYTNAPLPPAPYMTNKNSILPPLDQYGPPFDSAFHVGRNFLKDCHTTPAVGLVAPSLPPPMPMTETSNNKSRENYTAHSMPLEMDNNVTKTGTSGNVGGGGSGGGGGGGVVPVTNVVDMTANTKVRQHRNGPVVVPPVKTNKGAFQSSSSSSSSLTTTMTMTTTTTTSSPTKINSKGISGNVSGVSGTSYNQNDAIVAGGSLFYKQTKLDAAAMKCCPAQSRAAAVSSAANITASNIGIVYPNKDVATVSGAAVTATVTPVSTTVAAATAAAYTPTFKGNYEMQIIPTTNPPGSCSSKQFDELPPSISLTAVQPIVNAKNSSTTGTAAAAAAAVKKPPPLPPSSSSTTTVEQQFLSAGIRNKLQSTADGRVKQPLLNKSMTNLVYGCLDRSGTGGDGKASSSGHSKGSSAGVSSSMMSLGHNSPFSSNSHDISLAQITPYNVGDNSCSNKSLQSMKAPPHGGITLKDKTGKYQPISSSSMPFFNTTSKSSLSSAAMQDLGNAATTFVSTGGGGVGSGGGGGDKKRRIELNSANLSAVKNALSMRQLENKQSQHGAGVFIIETSNKERGGLTIGTPTKSVGGTTITKITSLEKRKTMETPPESESVMSTKRLKVANLSSLK